MGTRVLAITLLLAGAAFADVLYTSQATAAADAPLFADHRTDADVIATIPANTSITLITGPYNDWWYVQAGEQKGWMQAVSIARLAKWIPSGTRWIDVTIDDAHQSYVARLLVGTTVVDEMNVALGRPENPTPTGTYSIIYRSEALFELPNKPGIYLKHWQTFRYDGPGTLAWGLHSWVLDKDGWPVGLDQFGRVSSGCVRLPRPSDVYAFLSLGATVHIHTAPWEGPSDSKVRTLEVLKSNVNVRSGPGTGFGIVGKVQAGQKYVGTQFSQGWYRIPQGWVYGALVQTTSGEAIRVNTSVLNVRSGPGTTFAIVGKIYLNQRYVVAAKQGDWTQIWFHGQTAWVKSSYASPY